ncbi:MAG: hypothetical protein DRP71_11005 [Verrucomicrobia bacterium]|nr:MAG: hypothetical protein DRP71_11005 [Verrucomicrobiota bacterium]
MLSPLPRSLNPLTPLGEPSEVLLVPPDLDPDHALIQPLIDALRSVGANLRIIIDPGERIPERSSGPTFLIGNLRDNPWVRDLYYRFFCATDCTYPGPGGYEVRTLMDPLGTGHNIIHLGYSDTDGFKHGLGLLIDSVAVTLPFLSEIKATRLPLPEHYAEMIRSTPMPDLDWKLESHDAYTHRGYLAYLTGDRDVLESSQEIWRAIINYGVPEGDFNVRDLHLRMSHIVSSFRLLECVGMIGDELRGPFFQFILDWIHSDQGVSKTDVPLYTATDFPRQNHGLIPGLALAFFSDYCQRHHPDLESWRDWQSIAQRIFQPYTNGSWKPLCDGLCHGWFLSQPPMLDYAMLEPEHRYFESDGVRRGAECALAIINNQGWMPSSGDGTMLRAFPGPILRAAAAWYQDGRYLFAHSLAEGYRSNRSQVFLPRAFDRGVQPVEPTDSIGLTVIDLDPIVYRVWEDHPDLVAGIFDTPPDTPIERCFDKLAFRSGWGRSDAYLLIDGLGSGSHAYADTLDVIDYSRHGYSFLVSESGIYYPETENHSVLTVVRNGLAGKVPSFAELIEKRIEPDGSGYVRLRLNNTNGTDWIREVFFLPQIGVLFHDTVRAKEAGSYVLENHFRVPGKATFKNEELRALREDEVSGTVHFLLQGTCSHDHTKTFKEQDKSLQYSRKGEPGMPPEESLALAWKCRYGTDDQVVSVFTSRSVLEMKPGHAVSFTHFARIRADGEPLYSLDSVDGSRVTLTGPNEPILLACHESPTPAEPSRTPPYKSGGRKSLNFENLYECESDITSVVSGPDHRTIFGTENGLVAKCGPNSNLDWEVRLESRVHDISAAPMGGEETFYVGHGDSMLSRISRGRVIWTRTIEAIPSYSAWWALYHPTAVRVVVGRQPDDSIIYVGCGDKILRGFSPDGEELWTFRYDNGIPARLLPIDLDHDGCSEVLAGGEVISNQSTCRILRPTGKLLAEIPVEGWTSRLSAVSIVESDDSWILAVGSNRGENLQVFDLSSSGDREEPLPFQRRFSLRLGGEVNGLVIDRMQNCLFASTAQGCLLRLDLDRGDPSWNRTFAHPIAKLEPASGHLLVVDATGHHHLLDHDGTEVAEVTHARRWTSGYSTDSGVVFSSGNQLLRMSLDEI